MKLVFVLILFSSSLSFAQALPAHWAELKAFPPNVVSLVYMNSIPERESSVNLQVHPIQGKVLVLRDQIQTNKLPKAFGKMDLLSQEKIYNCTRLNLHHKDKELFFERQTWCFGESKAWVVVERGPWHLGDSTIQSLLKKQGWSPQ